MQNLTVVKSNRVIEAGYKLSLTELKIISTCIAHIDPFQELDSNLRFEVSAKDLSDLTGNVTQNEYRDLKEAAERLLGRIVTINNPYPDEPKVTQLKTHWISFVAYIPEEGKIRIGFASEITPYLSQMSKEFTCYRLKHIGKMNSIYAIRLYELLMQWRTTGSREIELAWLRQQFELEDKYSSIKDLKLKVIDPAVKDINTHSNLDVAWEQRKTGRRVTHLTFTFAEKQPEPPPQAKPAKPKAKGKMINGVVQSEIEAKARVGESYEAAAERIKKEKAANVKKLREAIKKT